MPKKRKTRKEKILTDQKKTVVHTDEPQTTSSDSNETVHSQPQQPVQNITFSLSSTSNQVQPAPRKPKPATTTTVISTEDYGYLGVDLLKTAIVTSAIIITEIIIRILFRG